MQIDKTSERPIYLQIYDHFTNEIINGYLIAGERLPSRRALAKNYGIAERTVENAYYKLISDGYAVSRKGSGYFVSPETVWDDRESELKSSTYNFSSNGIETSKLPFSEWARLLKHTVCEDTGLFQHGNKAGEWCLRKSIRRMLFRTRSIKCRTEQIIIGPGAEDLLRELFLLFNGSHPILMDNYYNYRVNGVAMTSGISPIYIKSGEDGIFTDSINKYKKALLYQKPVHALPTGITLSAEKRAALIQWAQGDNYIIEDGSDDSYQFNKKTPTLYELAEGRNVIYLGSFSKTIAPSMKIGYVIAPDEIVKWWFDTKRFYSNRVSRIEQVTLSKFIDLGHYERHIEYMRDIYREKARTLRNAVENSALSKHAQISGDGAGTFCRIDFDIPVLEHIANQRLADCGIKVSTLNSCTADTSLAVFPKNVYTVGYGELKISEIKDGIRAWEKAWKKWL